MSDQPIEQEEPLALAITAVRDALVAGNYAAAQQQACELLGAYPLVAQLWLYLGEALLHMKLGNAARAAFERASLLDPQATWGAAANQALAQVAGSARSIPAAVAQLLAVKPVTITAAILTYNGERTIERCLQSLQGAVDEIILIDSSSTDQTLHIAARYPNVRVLRDIPLNDDFAGKRNQALPHITTDWVLWIDADEWLEPDDKLAVRELAGLFDQLGLPAILNVCQVNYIGDSVKPEYSLPRMFALRYGFRYHGRVHEQVIMEGHGMFDQVALRPSVRIRLHHDGYQPAEMNNANKIARNLRLLERMASEEPDNPGWLLYYGRELIAAGKRQKAEAALRQAEQVAVRTPQFGRILDIHLLLITLLFSEQRYSEAARVCKAALELHPDFPDVLYWQAQIQLRSAAQLLQQAEHTIQQAKSGFHSYRGVVSASQDIMSWKADAVMADLAKLAGKPAKALAIYEAILARHPHLSQIRKRYEQLKAAHSG